MFQTIAHQFQNIFRTLRGYGKLSEKNIEDGIREIRISLLAADVHVAVVKDFINEVRTKALGEAVLSSLTPDQQFIKIIHDELVKCLGKGEDLNLSFKPPVVVLCVGLQGSGKTTTVVKLASYLSGKGKRCTLVPADLARPAAVLQLTTLGKKIGVDVYPTPISADPLQVVRQAVREAVAYDVCLIDTAGRLHVDDAMMAEVGRIAAEIKPQQTLFIADAMTGQDAVKSAKAFADRLPLTGVVLTKLDGDTRGGAALSIRKVTGKPILFFGCGEGMADLEPFRPDRMASRILGMGDTLSLIEEAVKVVEKEEAEAWAKKTASRQLTLADFRDQLRAVKKMGSMKKILGLLPLPMNLKEGLGNEDLEKEMTRKEAIINSMTPEERRQPKILNGSRRQRIARGCGLQVADVNKLLREFEMMQTMMKKLGKGERRMKLWK